jgi:hypothetical protein
MASETERTKLTERARDLLNGRPRTVTLDQLATATQTNVSWLSKFGRGQIARPKLRTVQRLHDHLRGR